MAAVDWALDLPELVWFAVCKYLIVESGTGIVLKDIARLSATCRTLYHILWSTSSTSLWCHLLLHIECVPRRLIDQVIDLLQRSGGDDDDPSMHRRLFAKRRKRQARAYRSSFVARQQDKSPYNRRWFRSTFYKWVAPARDNIRGHIALERSDIRVELTLQRRHLSTGLLQLYYSR